MHKRETMLARKGSKVGQVVVVHLDRYLTFFYPPIYLVLPFVGGEGVKRKRGNKMRLLMKAETHLMSPGCVEMSI